MSTSLCNRSQPVPVSSVTSPSIMPRNTGSAPLQHLGREKWNDHEKNQALRFPLRELVGSLPHTRLSTSKFKQKGSLWTTHRFSLAHTCIFSTGLTWYQLTKGEWVKGVYCGWTKSASRQVGWMKPYEYCEKPPTNWCVLWIDSILSMLTIPSGSPGTCSRSSR